MPRLTIRTDAGVLFDADLWSLALMMIFSGALPGGGRGLRVYLDGAEIQPPPEPEEEPQ